MGLTPAIRFLSADDWIETPAKILKIDVTEDDSGDGRSYERVIHFEYDWEGTRYTSTRFSFSKARISSAEMEAFVHAYVVGSVHPGYVNPDDPTVAVLDNQFSWDYFGIMLLGFVVMAVGLLTTYIGVFWKMHKPGGGNWHMIGGD